MTLLPATRTLSTAPRRAIWVAGSHDVTVYRGTAVEIVRSMASEMDESLSVGEVVCVIAQGLACHRGIKVSLPRTTSDDVLAEAFVEGLLSSRLFHPMPSA